ncbi:efflux transporter outer membrane subunit [Trinickia fusca]|uniref:Efflux transporter outer membrane subunit n=1 Tax=Trinickia fusca TaxID=2419777 RepID=A0A494XA03_9BURK|nr:efflux transporter outer membrane subunit [Trinickia fusca]RKP45276.1 efflux transporter outer membrane subunit [Trinickia fusca]
MKRFDSAAGIMRTAQRVLAGGLLMALVAACSLEPQYKRPDMGVPSAFKETPEALQHEGTWKAAQPSDALERGQWWTIFGDETLNKLEEQARAANPDLKAAAARVRQSRASLDVARSAWFPELDAGFGPTRERLSPASQGLPQNADVPPMTLWRAQATASYEADLFGRVGSNVSAARADSQQSEALYRSVQLALQADVAATYFALRELDTEQDLFSRTVALREEGVKLVQRRFDEGEVSELDLSQAKNSLASAQADAVGVARQRAAAEHSLAILLGKLPSDFSFAQQPLVPVTAKVPPGLPSALLERRPDIAAAERAMAAANARVGLARSAFFPKLDITGAFGYESAGLGELFMWSSRTFLLGPFAGTALSLPIFDGGRRKAQLTQAHAQYDEDVAQYRSQVLTAFREVEDSLSDLRLLDDQIHAQNDAVDAAKRAQHLSQTQYREGQISYLDVLDSERSVLAAERQASQLTGAQAESTVSLIRALGGGWGDMSAPKAIDLVDSDSSGTSKVTKQ